MPQAIDELMATSLYETSKEFFVPTELAGGPWSRDAQHGAAPAALMLDRMCATGVPGRLTRATIELTRPVPMTPLTLNVEVTRNGRQVQRTEARLFSDGALVAKAEGLHIVPNPTLELPLDEALMRNPDERSMPPLAASTAPEDIGVGRRVTFARNAVEIRVVESSFTEYGPGAAWFRLCVPVVNDEPIRPWSRLAAACDFSNGVSLILPWREYLFANADLTISAAREPTGEWVGLSAVTRASDDGIAITDGRVSDESGVIGVTQQSVGIRARPPRT